MGGLGDLADIDVRVDVSPLWARLPAVAGGRLHDAVAEPASRRR